MAGKQFEYALLTSSRSFFLVEFLGLEFTYTLNSCIAKFQVQDFYFDPIQQSYGNGLLTTIMDITMAHLCKNKTGYAGATVELTSKYVHPLTVGPATCRARFNPSYEPGGFLLAEIYDVHDKLISQATATWKL